VRCERGDLEEGRVKAGPLTLSLVDGSLRQIRWGGREILRRVYVAVRDRNWNTVGCQITKVTGEEGADHFRMSFLASSVEGPIQFAWKGFVTGDSQGTVSFRMEGEASSDFLANRIGICVLHPIKECAGSSVRVLHTDGMRRDGIFPEAVSPHQPWKEIRALAHQVAPDAWAEVTLDGEVFEMEDQRNWTDASFKTYSTPLELPFPVQIRHGQKFIQSMTLRLQGFVPTRAQEERMTVDIEERPSGPFPSLGVHRRSPLGAGDLAKLKRLGLAHLRVDVWPRQENAPEELARASQEAGSIGAALEIAAHIGPLSDLDRLAGLLAEIRPMVSAILVFADSVKSTPRETIAAARAALPGIRIGGGTDAYFAELNRRPPPCDRLDLVTFSSNPQVHLSDDLTLVENLEGLGEAIRSARALAGATPVAVSPITLRPRSNPNATAPDPEPPPDPRQRLPFGAAWTAGCLRALAESGASSATFYEASGPRGLFEGDVVFPLYRVFLDVAGAQSWVRSTSSDPLRVESLSFLRQGQLEALVANVSGEPVEIDLRGAFTRTLKLGPYGMERLRRS
jgi:hypothetical protein